MIGPSLSERDFESVVRAAIQAPSADNHHVVAFEALQDGIAISVRRQHADAPVHRRLLNLVGVGAVMENALLRLNRLGHDAAVEWSPDAARPELLAIIRLQGSCDRPSDLEEAIQDRHTNRGLFRGPPLTSGEQRQLERDSAQLPGVQLFWCDDVQSRARILRVLRMAESERFRSRALHEELFSSIRFDVGWHATAEEGLPPGALGIAPAARLLFQQLRRWPLMRAFSSVGAHHLLGLRATDIPCRLAPHVCFLATSLDLQSGSVAVGRTLERAWLRATKMGLAFQAFAAPALFALSEYRQVRASLRHQLKEAWDQLAPGLTPLIVFRMGRAPRPHIRSSRRPLANYINESPADAGLSSSPV